MRSKYIRRYLCAAICLLMPRFAKPFLLRACGHPIAKDARIGFSLVLVDRLAMQSGASIGAFNILALRRCALRAQAHIGRVNVFKHDFSLRMGARSKIGNRNIFIRGWTP